MEAEVFSNRLSSEWMSDGTFTGRETNSVDFSSFLERRGQNVLEFSLDEDNDNLGLEKPRLNLFAPILACTISQIIISLILCIAFYKTEIVLFLFVGPSIVAAFISIVAITFQHSVWATLFAVTAPFSCGTSFAFTFLLAFNYYESRFLVDDSVFGFPVRYFYYGLFYILPIINSAQVYFSLQLEEETLLSGVVGAMIAVIRDIAEGIEDRFSTSLYQGSRVRLDRTVLKWRMFSRRQELSQVPFLSVPVTQEGEEEEEKEGVEDFLAAGVPPEYLGIEHENPEIPDMKPLSEPVELHNTGVQLIGSASTLHFPSTKDAQREEGVAPTPFSRRIPECETPGLCCALSGQRLRDPVIASDGFTYERHIIENFLMDNVHSPVTGQPLASCSLLTNFTLRGQLTAETEVQEVDGN